MKSVIIMLVFIVLFVSLAIGLILLGSYLIQCTHRDEQNEASKKGLDDILRSIHK